nr:putative ribonuclease H-like domain-containing protein [Tanacetum cinerariifolium]
MRNEEVATWDGGEGTWGGRARVFGTVPVCVRVQERAGETSQVQNGFCFKQASLSSSHGFVWTDAPSKYKWKAICVSIVDDYSRYTWVFFLHSKDEASKVIISFIKKTQVNLQPQVQRVRTDNSTEFKNKTLAKFFDEIMKSSTTNVETSINEEVFHEVSELFQRESYSSSLNDDVQQCPKEVILPQTNTQSILNNMIPNSDEASTSHNVFNERLEDAYIDAIIKTKWIFKNKKDESSLVIQNKA